MLCFICFICFICFNILIFFINGAHRPWCYYHCTTIFKIVALCSVHSIKMCMIALQYGQLNFVPKHCKLHVHTSHAGEPWQPPAYTEGVPKCTCKKKVLLSYLPFLAIKLNSQKLNVQWEKVIHHQHLYFTCLFWCILTDCSSINIHGTLLQNKVYLCCIMH